MKTTNQKAVLMERIISLQNKQSQDLQCLKNQYQLTIESFKPLNLIKSSFQEVASSSVMKSDLLNGALNLVAGLISKKLPFGITEKPIKNLVSTIFKFVVKKIIPTKE